MTLVGPRVSNCTDGEHLVITEAHATVEAEVEAELQRVVTPGFMVNSPETAAWVVRRVLIARQYLDRVKIWAEAERRRAVHEEERLLYLFGGQLRHWAEGEIAKLRGRRRTIALPGGQVGLRAVPLRVLIRDEELVMKWAKQACPTAVVTSERLLKTPVVQHVERTGEIPAGIEIVPPHDEFFVR
jgi:hypothetical protein